MDNRRISEYYAALAHDVIYEYKEMEHLRHSDVQIIYLASEHEKKSKGKIVYGQCEKVADKYKWGIPCDFTITIFEPNVEGFTDDQLKIVLFHELLHVGIDENGEFSIRPHDLEDFKAVIDRFGTDWNK